MTDADQTSRHQHALDVLLLALLTRAEQGSDDEEGLDPDTRADLGRIAAHAAGGGLLEIMGDAQSASPEEEEQPEASPGA